MQANPMLGLLFQQALNAHRTGQLNKACKLYQAVLQMEPGHFDALHFCGLALADTGQAALGARHIEQALQRNPLSPPALSNLASIYRTLGRLTDARQTYERALSLQPGFAEALNGLGNLLYQEKDFGAALKCFDAAISGATSFPEAYNNRGNTLFALRRLDEATASFREAIALQPTYAEAYNNLGFSLVALRRCEEALDAYDQALKLAPTYERARLNKGLCHLLMGDYAAGWPLYEFRWADRQKAYQRKFDQPLWQGLETLDGKTVLLHAEQGLGDSIQFCRYIPMVARLARQVIVEVPAPLLPLLETLACPALLIEEGRPLPPFDLHCPLASLPLAFTTGIDSIPADIPYLSPDAEKSSIWARELAHHDHPRIGLVWAGSQTDPHRAISPDLLFDALPPAASIICVQKDIGEADRAQLMENHPELSLHGQRLADFSDTAALLANLDLLITIDTSVAHLAGALGIPAWVLLHSGSDWRWMREGSASPWYPSIRLFRQECAGDWSGLIQRQIRPALETFMRDNAPR